MSGRLPPETGYVPPSGHSHHLAGPIEGSGDAFPPPPDWWRPVGLTRLEEGDAERALWDRVRRIAAARGISVREAALVVTDELRTPVSGAGE